MFVKQKENSKQNHSKTVYLSIKLEKSYFWLCQTVFFFKKMKHPKPEVNKLKVKGWKDMTVGGRELETGRSEQQRERKNKIKTKTLFLPFHSPVSFSHSHTIFMVFFSTFSRFFLNYRKTTSDAKKK